MSIRLHNITLKYGSRLVLDNFSADLGSSGVTALRAPSGVGKTSVLRILAGLICPTSGQVFGMDGKRVSAVFQEPRLLDWLSVFDNVKCVAPDRSDRASELLLSVGLDQSVWDMLPRQLSGGMQQRVAIARALMIDFDILLLDEPFSALDSENISTVEQLIYSYRENSLIVLVTHDNSRTKSSDRVVELPVLE